jgi:hypothetical protein
MDVWDWIEIVWRLIQPIGTIAMAVVLFLWWLGFRENKNAIIEMKEERLKEKEDQLKSKEEQLKSKDEQLKAKDEQLTSKDEQLKAVKQENDLLKLLSVEAMQKNLLIMKGYYEGQIGQLENEKRAIELRLQDAQMRLELDSFSSTSATNETRQEVDDLSNTLQSKQIELAAFRESEEKFRHMSLNDLYGPVGKWLFHFKFRDEQRDLANKLTDARKDFLKEVRDYYNTTVEEAIAWASAETQKASESQTADKEDDIEE